MTSTPRHKPNLTAVFGLAVVLVMALSLSACGGSDGEGDGGSATDADTAAFADVCTAAEKIKSKIEEFGGYDPDAAAGIAQIPNKLDDVRVAMSDVNEQIAKLDAEDRQKAEAAAKEFTSAFVDSGFELSDKMSSAAGDSDADEQIKAAAGDVAEDLEKAYESAYSKLGCS